MGARRLVKRTRAPIVSVQACSGKIVGFSAGASSQSLYLNAAASAGVRLTGRVLGTRQYRLSGLQCAARHPRCTLARDSAAARRSF